MASGTGGINGTAVAVLLAGSVLAYSGIKGFTITKTLRDFLAGQTPQAAAVPQGTVNYNDTPPQLQTGPGSAGLAHQLASFLGSHGMSRAGRCGFLGNAQLESTMSTTSENPDEGAIGLFQWEGGRRTALRAYAHSHGLQETDAQAQFGYLWLELMSTESATLLLTMRATHPQIAAKNIDYYFERSKHEQTAAKMASAQQYFDAGY